MYKTFFGLTENPFSISPNPKYLYMSERHTEALAHLTYGLRDGGGFVLLTGEVGTGKTTVCRCLRQQLPADTELVLVHNPTLDERELLATLCDEFGLGYAPDVGIKTLFDLLHRHLLANQAAGRRTLLLIDEAQHLQPAVLEQLRLLTNLETDDSKLLQVVLVGQPELQLLLRQPLLRQLAQRITARYHLLPLSAHDVDAYVRFRLQVAGCLQPLFSPASLAALHRLSGGIPRLINLICERALLAAYAQGRPQVGKAMLLQAAREAMGVVDEQTEPGGLPVLAYGLCGLLLLGAGWFGWQQWGWLPPRETVRVEVPVKLPPDAELQQRFAEALQQAGYEDEALQQLFRVWGYDISLEEASCDQAERATLLCQQGSASLAELIKLDHPAQVRLVDEQGQSFYATLLGVDEQQADLLLGGESWTVDLSWLEKAWGSDYTLLWKLPEGGSRLISARSSGQDVQWLETALAQVLKERPRQLSRFDAQLGDKLKRFQQAEGLEADGVAGPQTLMRLNARSGESMPRLSRILARKGNGQPEGERS